MLSTKQSKTTKTNNWVHKDLSKSPKKKWFEQNTVPWTAQKNRTTKNWVEEDINKFPKKDPKETVKMSCLCKAGLFFLR